MRRILFLSLLCVLSFSLLAQEQIKSFKIPLTHPNLERIATEFEVVRKLEDGFEVYVLVQEEKKFLTLAPGAHLLENDINAYLKSLQNQKASLLDSYHNYSSVESELQGWAKNYSQLAQLETYGTTAQGRKLYALRLGTPGASKPELMISAATHGDELITVEVLMALVKELLEGYGKDQRLTKMLDEHVLYILPMSSPDGYANKTRYVAGKDPNRVFPWPGNTSVVPLDCTQAWMDLTAKHKFVGSVDLHAFGRMAMYPWGYTTEAPRAADEADMSDLVTKMSQQNRYKAGQISTTIYVAKGNSADYFYWKNNTKAIAVELGDQKIPNPSKIPSIVNESREMMWQFIEHF